MDRDIPDTIPEGYINLVEAWERFSKRENRTHDPEYEDLLSAFASGELEVLFREPGDIENKKVPIEGWQPAQFFRERTFLIQTIPYNLYERWGGLEGRTPFIRKIDIDHWINEYFARTHVIDDTQNEWSLFTSVLWVASTATNEPSEERFIESSKLLFDYLYRNPSKLIATGLNEIQIRETIPHVYWECATANEPSLDELLGETLGSGHTVGFIDDLSPEMMGGTLTIVGTETPKWSCIEIAVDDLMQAFPKCVAVSTGSLQSQELGRESDSKPATVTYEDDEVSKWFKETYVEPWMNDCDNSPRITRDGFHKLANEGPFPGITKTQSRKVWKMHRPKGWSVPGRHKRIKT